MSIDNSCLAEFNACELIYSRYLWPVSKREKSCRGEKIKGSQSVDTSSLSFFQMQKLISGNRTIAIQTQG